MSDNKQNELSGVLFRNAKKTIEKHPDYTGSALISGTDFWVSGWINESKNGVKYMSLKFQPKEAEAVKAEPIEGSGDVPF
jgi:uncharacterized protein (DUF736 family)